MQMYPVGATERDRFILNRREPRPLHDPWRHQGIIVEDERTADGRIARAATVFLTGRECPWRCVMCDLWQYTIAGDTPRGAIPTQIAAARDELRGRPEVISQLKLYNAGSFFDPRALPEEDYDGVAAAHRGPRARGRRIASGTRRLPCRFVSRSIESSLRRGHGDHSSKSRWALRPCTLRPSIA